MKYRLFVIIILTIAVGGYISVPHKLSSDFNVHDSYVANQIAGYKIAFLIVDFWETTGFFPESLEDLKGFESNYPDEINLDSFSRWSYNQPTNLKENISVVVIESKKKDLIFVISKKRGKLIVGHSNKK
jgi:hypothetical protein